ncbi:hypothetical protein SO694_00006264 [Aureococcus anophagefferens]|uniref:Phospholipid scramblase n=1 Tax=Aureococcus anophagefferens TaxID=44056 RepID=A0ABR1GA02_AURAN
MVKGCDVDESHDGGLKAMAALADDSAQLLAEARRSLAAGDQDAAMATLRTVLAQTAAAEARAARARARARPGLGDAPRRRGPARARSVAAFHLAMLLRARDSEEADGLARALRPRGSRTRSSRGAMAWDDSPEPETMERNQFDDAAAEEEEAPPWEEDEPPAGDEGSRSPGDGAAQIRCPPPSRVPHFPPTSKHLAVDVVVHRSPCFPTETTFAAFSLGGGPPQIGWNVYGAQDSMVAPYPGDAVLCFQLARFAPPPCPAWCTRCCARGKAACAAAGAALARRALRAEDERGRRRAVRAGAVLLLLLLRAGGRLEKTGPPIAVLEFTKTGGAAHEAAWAAVLKRGSDGREFATFSRPGVACCYSYCPGSAYDVTVSGKTTTVSDARMKAGRSCCSCRDVDWSRDVSPEGAGVVGKILRSNVSACRKDRLRPTMRHPANSPCHFGCDDVFVPATYSVALPAPGADHATLWFAALLFSHVSSDATFRSD